MPVATKNTELVPKRELATLIKYNEELIKSKNNLGEIIPVLHSAALGLETYTGDYKTLVQMLKSYEKMQADTKKAVDDYGRSISALAAAEKRYAQSLSDEGKQLAIVKEQTRQQNQENRTMAKEVLAADNSLNKLRATLSRLKAEAATLDIDSEEFAKATADIKALNDKILKAEQSMGVHTRNVGNYSSAFNNLGLQVQQVARELPSLTVSTGQFFLAISNNLPMLADAYKDTIDKNKAIREANKGLAADMQQKVVPAWAQMLKSVISWQTFLVVGVTLLTAYSKEIGQFFSELFKGRKELDASEFSMRKYAESIAAGRVEAVKETAELETLYEAATDLNRSYEERLIAADKLQEMYPSYFANLSDEAILTGNAIDKYRDLKTAIIEAAEARAIMDTITENSQAIINIEESDEYDTLTAYANKIADFNNKIVELNEKGISDGPIVKGLKTNIKILEDNISRISKDLAKKLELPEAAESNVLSYLQALYGANEKLKQRINIDSLYDDGTDDGGDDGSSSTTTTQLSEKRQAEIGMEKAQAEEAAAIQQSIYENESKSYAEREIALTNFYAKKRELAQIDYEASKEELDARLAAGEIDQATYDAVLASLDLSKSTALGQLKRDQQEAGRELAQAIADGMMERMGTAAENVAKELDTAMQSELLALASEYKQGLIDKEEFEKKKADIADKYRRQQFEKEISILESELKYFTHSAEDRERVSKMLAEKQVEYNQYKNDQQIASDIEAGDAAAEIEKSKASLKMQLLDEVFNFASTLNNAWLEKETDRLDKESEANEKWQEEEIERIERLEEQGVISKEQAEARKQQIEDQAAANEEEIEKKRIEAQRQAAIYDKAISAAQAGIAIALSITKSLATPALIPWIAALGAVQLATILATPIPEYARGTDDHGGGLAIVGDGGRPELVVLPDRTMWRTPATDTLVNLPEHAQVFPDYYAAVRELAVPRLEEADIPIVDMSGVTRRQDQAADKIAETNRLIRVSIARADKRSKNDMLLLSNRKSAKLWN